MRLAALVLAYAAVAGCTLSRGGPAPPSPTAAPALELVPGESQRFGFGPLPVGTYVAYGLSTGAVHAPVTVLDVQPLEQSGPVEFVGSHLAFYACGTCHRRPGTYGVKVLLGATCGARDLHGRAVLTAVGQDLVPGDAPHFVVVGRITGVGPATMKGVRVTYRAGSGVATATSPTHSATVDPDEAAQPCPDPRKELWFGGAIGERQTVRLD